jgi:hypothetical protein
MYLIYTIYFIVIFDFRMLLLIAYLLANFDVYLLI